MKLYKAIKKVFEDLGLSSMESNLFINALADYEAFQEVPAIKQILKDFVSEGYGVQLKKIICTTNESKDAHFLSLKTKFIHTNGYKEDLVDYLFSSIAYATGLNKIEPQYNSKQSIVHKDNTHLSIKDLNNELINLQADYINKLASLYESPENNSTALYGLYSADSLTELWLIEQKITIVNTALGINNDTWCEKQKKKFIESRANNRRLILHERLDDCKNEYIDQLSSLITIPKNFIYTQSGFYTESALNVLKQKEDIIRQLDKSLGTTALKDCLDEKTKILNKYSRSVTKQLTQIVLKAVIPITIMAATIFLGGSYFTSKDEIDLYNSTMLQAENYISEKEYINAIVTFDKAQAEYDGNFNTKGFKQDAVVSKERACKLLLEHKRQTSIDLFTKGEYLNSRKELESIKTYMITPALLADYNLEYEKLIKQIESAIEKDKNTIMLNIASNNGKLNTSGKKLLKELLEICPEDYWLNIIQKKHK